jgi:hypothetical protein
MSDPSVELVGVGFPIGVKLRGIYELESEIDAVDDDEEGEKQNWEIALENTEAYDVGTQMSLALTCPDKNGGEVVWPMIISLL